MTESCRAGRAADWLMSSQQQDRSKSKYVGLRNLGCTCYMNSLIQQLFMHAAFRNSVLRVAAQQAQDRALKKRWAQDRLEESSEEESDLEFTGGGLGRTRTRTSGSSDVLHELQVVFMALQSSHKTVFSPKGLCGAIKVGYRPALH